MMDTIQDFKNGLTLPSVIVGAVIFLVGGVDNMVKILAGLMLVNYFSGLIKSAFLGEKYQFEKAWKGLVKIGMAILVFIVGNLADQIAPNDIDAFRKVAFTFLSGYYGFSTLYNAKMLGFPIPQKLFDFYESKEKGA